MKVLSTTLLLLVLLASARAAETDLAPKPHYGRVAMRLVGALESRHLLRQNFDDVLSQRAWTNLVTAYDANRSVFLKPDIDRLLAHERTIDDELKAGRVDFGYEVYRLYCQRLQERIDFATNLLNRAEWDFSEDESYCFKRDKSPWPETREEADELWRRRMKNEVLGLMLSREIDAEEAATRGKEAASAGEGGEEPSRPKDTPEQTLVKRYRMLGMALTESDAESVLQTYLSAACRAYDPHTDYLSPMTKEDFDMSMNLKLCGVGAVLQFDDGMVKIVEIMKGGPMDVDGRLHAGDRIVGVKQGDGEMEDVVWQPLRKTVRKIRGEKGSRVTLEIVPRNDPTGGSRKLVELVRDEIRLDDQRTTGHVARVSIGRRELKVGYVKVPEFYGSMDRKEGEEGYVSCSDDVLKYLEQFNTENVAGVVLDLRGNGGGSLPEAIKMSALFVSSGPVVLVRNPGGMAPLMIERGNTVACRKPLIVMIDRNSASASEIVAGHLRDVGRAVVVGDGRSHGKGTVQSVMPLGMEMRRQPDGTVDRQDCGSTKITTMRFYRVNGRSTQVRGVESDIHLPSNLDSLDVGDEEKLPYALPFSRIRGPEYRMAWNLPTYAKELAERSARRTSEDPKFVRHVANVAAVKALFDRTEVPLERGARKLQMKADREIRELEDPDGEDDGEEPIVTSRRRKKEKREDPVLDETFQVMGDLVELTAGEELPRGEKDWYNLLLGL